MPPSLQKLICVSRLKCMLYADHVLLPKSLRRPPHTTETAILHVPLPTGALRSPLGTVCATMKGCSNYASTYRQRHNRVHTHWNCAAVITACEATAGANPFDAASQCRSPEQMLRQTLTHTHRLSIPISSPHMFHILRQTNVFFAGVALTFKKPQSHLRHRRMATLPDASTQRSPHAHPGRQNPRSALENPTPRLPLPLRFSSSGGWHPSGLRYIHSRHPSTSSKRWNLATLRQQCFGQYWILFR